MSSHPDSPGKRPTGFWMGVLGCAGMALGALVAYLSGRPVDAAMGTGACLGVTLGAFVGLYQAWR